MILFAGIPSEAPIAMAIEAAERRGLPFRIFNPRRAADCDVRLEAGDMGAGPVIWVAGEAIEINACSGIYARTVDPASIPEWKAAEARGDQAAQTQIEAVCILFDQALDLTESLVVNRPSAMASNFSKPAQLQAIAATGLRVPPTLVTNDPGAVRAFHREHKRLIYKSTSAVRSIVAEWTEAAGPSLERIRQLPVQFQALIPGTDVRVHVIGERVEATRIHSKGTDYRYDSATRMEPIILPEATAESCVRLTRSLELAFAGIDLRLTPEGDIYCFEVNPSPAYSYFEEQGGQPIAAALVDLLAGAS